jgi:hypothetical protein
LADTGYFSATNVAACTAAGIAPLIAAGRQPHHPSWRERFAAAPPASDDPTPIDAMIHRLRTADGKKLYALRKQPRSRSSASSNRFSVSVSFCYAGSTTSAASGASSPWPGT